MLNLSINVISTLNPDMQPVEPVDSDSIGTINLGLIDQFHYIALLKNNYFASDNNQHEETNAAALSLSSTFDQACRVKGAPFEPARIPENPELGGKIYFVAPGEGQKPLPIL